MLRFALVLAALLVSPPALSARTWHINPDGTGDFPTIQAALSLAAAGDTVEMACGTYIEHDLQRTGPVVLRSASRDPACVVIDAQEKGFVLVLAYADEGSLIEGLTLRRGSANGVGGGLQLFGGSVLVRNVVIEDNTSNGNGSGLALQGGATATVVGCRIVGNRGDDGPTWGGGAWVSLDSRAQFTHCLFAHNSAGAHGGALYAAGDVDLDNCTLVGNEARGINNTGGSGGHVMVRGIFTATLTVFANAIAGSAVHCNEAQGGTASVTCSNVWDNAGGDYGGSCLAGQDGLDGNFSADPLFCDADAADFHLQWGSLCLPANSPDGCGLIGAFGFGGCNSVSVAPESWARVKARYR